MSELNTGKYQAYPEYKDSGVEWLRNIPSDWKVVKLKFSTVLTGEKTLPVNAKYVGMENVSSKNGKYIETVETAPEGISNSFNEGDVLFGKLRPYLAKSWLAAFAGICSSEFLVLRSNLAHPKYLNYFMLTDEFIEQVNSSTYGSKMPRASWDFIGLLPMPVMGYKLSQKIANFLDHETAKIDALIEKQQQLIKLLKEKRQAVISHAVTKGLNPNAPMKDSGVEWLGEVPAHWGVTRAKYVSKIFVPQRNKPELNDSAGIAWATMEDMKQQYIYGTSNFVSPESVLSAGSKLLKEGAVIASCVGNFGVTSINKIDVIINQQLQAFQPVNIKAEYLQSIVTLSKQYFELIGTAATLIYVNQEGFENLPVLMPPEKEQNEISNYILGKNTSFDLLIEKSIIQTTLLKERRTALISAAVTGKIDVRNWEQPNDQ